MNWKKIVVKIITSGETEQSLSEKIGITQTKLHRIKHGTEPKYDVGKKILEIYSNL